MSQVFGADYSRMLADMVVLSALDERSPAEALERGVPPREVWNALCDFQQVSEQDRWIYRERARRPGAQ